MTILITITTAGEDLCDFFDLYSNLDLVTAIAQDVSLADLTDPEGYTVYNVPEGTESIKIQPKGEGCVCLDAKFISLVTTTTTTVAPTTTTTTIIPTTTTTSSSSSTTTTTTTEFPGPFDYYTVNSYICNGANCISGGGIGVIANYPQGATVVNGKFYGFFDAYNVWTILEITGTTTPQSGLIVSFNGPGDDTCSESCGA